MQFLRFSVIFVSLLEGLHSTQWSSTSPQDGDVRYICKEGSVTLSWKYVPASGDVIGDVQWLFDGGSQELVAVFTRGNFLPMPAFASRVQVVDNAGITVTDLSIADSGNYSVEIDVYRDSGTSHTILRRSVLVQVSDHQQLHVTQRSEAVLDTTTDQWSVMLQCGTFSFHNDPSFQVEWITPSGTVVNSSYFSNNHFNLLLANPAQGGNYTCRVPPQRSAGACLLGNGSGRVQASVYVDRIDVRLSLLEKENELLKEKLKQSNSSLSSQLQTLEQDKVDLQTRVEGLEGRTRQQIGFHATGLESHTPPYGTPLVINALHYNHGNAYDNTTGYFTTPYPGVYFFAATTGPSVSGGADHFLCVDDSQLTQAYSSYGGGVNQATAHAVVHLTTGQKVWVSSNGDKYWWPGTHFSGFLISPDP